MLISLTNNRNFQPTNTGVKNNPQKKSNRKSLTKLSGKAGGRAPGNNKGGRGSTTFGQQEYQQFLQHYLLTLDGQW
jgi:hypothetical protein